MSTTMSAFNDEQRESMKDSKRTLRASEALALRDLIAVIEHEAEPEMPYLLERAVLLWRRDRRELAEARAERDSVTLELKDKLRAAEERDRLQAAIERAMKEYHGLLPSHVYDILKQALAPGEDS